MLSAVAGRRSNGRDDAAAHLATLTKAQEAIFGGYYTGICTLSESGFHLTKDVGPLSNLSAQSEIAAMPGAAGIAHSRTKAGGSACRAQPFLGHRGLVAGMGTGIHGIFGTTHKEARQALAAELVRVGTLFPSAESGIGGSAELPDGRTVHNTDLVVQAVERQTFSGDSPEDAIRTVVRRVPTEGAYVFLFRDLPDALFVANFNQRLVVLTQPSSTSLLSSVLALDRLERSQAAEVPMNSLSVCRAGEFRTEVLDSERDPLLQRRIPSSLDESFLEYVRAHPSSTWSTIIEHALVPLFPTGEATLLTPLGFYVMERLVMDGRIYMQDQIVEGVTPGSTTVQAVFRVME